MQDFTFFLQEISKKSNLYFSIRTEKKGIIFESKNLNEDEEKVEVPISLSNSKSYISVVKKDENSLELLKYIIENKFKELHTIKEQLLLSVLKGKEVSEERINKNIPYIYNGYNMVVVKVDSSRLDILNIIIENYREYKIIGVIYDGLIVLLGKKINPEKIRSILIDKSILDITITYSDVVYSQNDIRAAFEKGKECIQLKKIFYLKEDILEYNKLLFEKIVYDMKEELKNELMDKFYDKFNSFDEEMTSTIEEFIKCGLNISEAAKGLYIHRNTLIYRLDKIKKETEFDIRNFKEAILFIIAYLVWKEKSSY
ncbi:MAG: PucR family transcriptional regulator [Clostridiaceae bacterium]